MCTRYAVPPGGEKPRGCAKYIDGQEWSSGQGRRVGREPGNERHRVLPEVEESLPRFCRHGGTSGVYFPDRIDRFQNKRSGQRSKGEAAVRTLVSRERRFSGRLEHRVE